MDRNRQIEAANIYTGGAINIATDQMRQRFYMFFTGLIFAILSFVGANLVKTHLLYINMLETISLFLLLKSGSILLLKLYFLTNSTKAPNTYYWHAVSYMVNHGWCIWFPFLSAIFFIIFNRCCVFS